MNLFRLIGDMSHLMAVIFLLLKVRATRSCGGISLKTQALYLTVFATRYLDLFTHFVSLYNSVMKLVFLGSSGSMVRILIFLFYHSQLKRGGFVSVVFMTHNNSPQLRPSKLSPLLQVYMMTSDPRIKRSYDRDQDTFRVEYLVGGAAAMGLLFNE